jgi:hypothetical protein
VRPRGFLSGDFHQHMKNSFDSAIPLEDRVISSVCEGLDFIVATDHNFITDLSPVIARLGLGHWIKSAIGDEATTRKHFFGHLIAFPLVPDTSKPNNGAIAFDGVTAAQMIDAANAFPGEQVVQINHPRSGDIGYFNQVYMNAKDATTTHLNWCDRFTAIEVFNGKRVEEVDETMRDWFHLLNIGYRFTATGNSDSHKIYDQEPGYPRNYVALAAEGAQAIKVEDVVNAVNEKHAVVVTNGPFVSFATKAGGAIGSQLTVKDDEVDFTARVEGANFVQPSSIEFYGNGTLLKKVPFAETTGSLKWEGTFADNPTSDTWYVAVVRGTHSMAPVVTPLVLNSGPIPPMPFALTNPIWVDRDGDGKFTALHEDKMASMHEDRSAQALANLDKLTSASQGRNRFSRRRAALPE